MEKHIITWRNVQIEITFTPDAFCMVDHIELRIGNKALLPVTETGYRSHFFGPVEPELSLDEVEQMFRQWLDEEAAKPGWQSHLRSTAQLSLF